jgi:4-hydroxythreonine-4-phosphate dehydrogenase
MNATAKVIGITPGDAAGIGPEVIRAALASGKLDARFKYEVIGKTPDAGPGKPTRETALAAFAALEEAAALALRGEIAAVVTGPVSKAQMRRAGFAFPGQTEFFANRCGEGNFAMCLTGGRLTVALVTIHVPLRAVPDALSAAEIVRVGRLLADFARLRLGRKPRIAVAGLNPHAGESGTMGREEIDVITPAIQELGEGFTGPLPPDTVFHHAARGGFDAVLCMYHDQGLIPLKLHAFDEGVNVTLGLPIIRTSPDHGTAFDIAGKGVAHPGSMIAAINLAAELAAKRQRSAGVPPVLEVSRCDRAGGTPALP